MCEQAELVGQWISRGCGSTILVMEAQREVKHQADSARHNQPNRKGAYAIARRRSANGKAVAIKIASMLPGSMFAKPKDLRSVPIPRLSRRLLGPRPSFSRCCSQRHRSARSAWRPRWKSPSEWTSSLLYAPHDSAPLPFALARKDPRMKMADLQCKDTKHETRTTSTRVNAGFQREFSRAQTTTPASLAGGGPP